MRSLVLAALCVVAVVATTTRNFEVDLHDYTFEEYIRDFSKEYTCDEEYAQHKQIFNDNLQSVIAHNAAGHSWRKAVNKFTDMTSEQLKKFNGYNKGMARANRALMTERPDFPYIPEDKLPTAVDWRQKGIITPVKDQGGCGSCWAFASTQSIESTLTQDTGKTLILGPQDIVSCTPNPDQCGGTGGCNGATAELAFAYVQDKGIATEADYPYTQTTGTCNTSVHKSATISGWLKLKENNYTDLLYAIATVGPISVSVDASSWFSYSSGVFTDCSFSEIDIDHAVQLVGYGTQSGKDYWIVRNSWGPSWGEKGFIRIEKHSDGSSKWCGPDDHPSDGTGCQGGPPQVTCCGSCGIWYDSSYPTGASLL